MRTRRALAVLGLAVLLAACGLPQAERDALPLAAESQTTGATAAAEPAPETETPEPSPSDTPSETETPEARPRTFTGSGAKVIRLKTVVSEAMLVQSVHRGQSNFTIYSISPDGEEVDLLANSVGNHRGTQVMNMSDDSETVALKVDGDGAWKITLKPITQARQWGAKPVRGHGDDVLLLQPASVGFQTITAEHAGESNFTVHGISSEGGQDLLVNEIGRSTAESTLPDGTVVVLIEGDGAWTLTRTS